MSVVRQITCNICNKKDTESKLGDGWQGWGVLTGKESPNGDLDFALCPEHSDAVYEFVGNLMGTYRSEE